MPRKHPYRRWLWVAFLLLLAASTIVRWRLPNEGELLPDQQRIPLPEYADGEPTGRDIQIAYRDLPANDPDAPTLVLIHGSPMGSKAMDQLIAELRGQYRLIVPDLPGFGGSTIDIADYSVETHATNVRDLLDMLEVNQAHLVGYSQGGGVILNLEQIAPERVASMTMLASIGVQELELLGDYTLNHALYSTQWLGLWTLQNFFPHFGYMDHGLINVAYARNFSDTDQRPLRGILENYDGPLLILHGEKDVMVPFAAATEHARIAPQASLKTLPDEGHMIPFTHQDWAAGRISEFVETVERSEAKVRSQLSPEQLAAAQANATPPEPARGWGLVFYFVVLIIGSFISEDLSCIAAGILASQGVIDFWSATIASLLGIFLGDVGLYALGRWLGHPSLHRAPMKWFLKEQDLEAAEEWFKRRGPALILITRFIPGSRLPTYFAAGVLRAPFGQFTFYLMIAAVVWTPILVGASMFLGQTFLDFFARFEKWAPLLFLGFIITMLCITKLVTPLMTWEGRRLMLGKWRRATRWEFWPFWAVYPPVIASILWQGLKHRAPALFTLSNPAMPMGGLVEESKSDILRGLAGAGDAIGLWTLLPPEPAAERLAKLDAFFAKENLSYPVALKPDIGQRGEGVAIIKNRAQAEDYLTRCPQPVIAQEFLPGHEYGVFYYRLPNEKTGVTWGITDKRFTSVTGDGEHSLRHLILADDRAVCSAPHFLKKHIKHLNDVPAKGEKFVLAELGTHCRGAVFLDGSHLITPELSARVDAVSQHYAGFYFGRYDVRAESEAALQRGEFRVIELNGVSSEATWIYDPKHGAPFGWKTLIAQWRIAFQIGAQNRANGIAPDKTIDVIRLIIHQRGLEVFEA
ncbi:alpha/beta fold hydrolase [Cerasicoccus maritimus]|uniref:alpha/beta fold hydrolase n=1 Tax=Cerasicoccus maritimus TaxID=490089 RepID=UPI0028527A3C|nr:alpha/beta fold hydrolase [Cerasicoccus maritimus]